MTIEVKFNRKEFESNKPKLGVSLSSSVLMICIAIFALAFGASVKTSLIGLVIGLLLSWISWPMYYFIKIAMRSDKYTFNGEVNILPKISHAEFIQHKDGTVSGRGKTDI